MENWLGLQYNEDFRLDFDILEWMEQQKDNYRRENHIVTEVIYMNHNKNRVRCSIYSLNYKLIGSRKIGHPPPLPPVSSKGMINQLCSCSQLAVRIQLVILLDLLVPHWYDSNGIEHIEKGRKSRKYRRSFIEEIGCNLTKLDQKWRMGIGNEWNWKGKGGLFTRFIRLSLLLYTP